MEQTFPKRLKIDLTLLAAALIASVGVLCANTSFAEIVDIIARIP